MKSFKQFIKGLKEDENTTTPQPSPFAPEDVKPEAPQSGRKKVQANSSPWSDKSDPNTINIGEVTPVDTDPQLDIKNKNPKPSNVPVGQNTTVEDVFHETAYDLSRQKSTLEKDMANAKYHRAIHDRVMEIVKRRQTHADQHGIRPFGNMAPMQTESSGQIVRHPVEVLGHIVDAAAKGFGIEARLNVHVPRSGTLGVAHSRLGSETNKKAAEKVADKKKTVEKPVEPERAKSVNDKLMDAVGKMGEGLSEGFVKRRYNVSDIHSEVDKFHPAVPHEAVESHVNNLTSHWHDPVQKSQAANDAISYHARRKKQFNHEQGTSKLSLASQAHDNGSGITENLGAPGGSGGGFQQKKSNIGGADGGGSSGGSSGSSGADGAGGIGAIDKSNVKKNKVRQGVGGKSNFSNKGWKSPGVTEHVISDDFGPVKWSDLKLVNEIMGYNPDQRNKEDIEKDYPKTKGDYLKHAIRADHSAKNADKKGNKWHAGVFRRIRDRHLVHYINKAEPHELHKLHRAMTKEEFEHMMKDKYLTKE